MVSPAIKALVVTLLAVGSALFLTTLISYSLIPQVDPQVFVSFNSNWVQLDLRYITGIKVRAKMHSELSAIILQYLSKNGITVASSNINVNVAEEK